VNLAIPSSGTIGTVHSFTFTLPHWGRIVDLQITLDDLTHTFPDDLDFLLLSQGGANFEFWSDVGGNTDITNGDFTISDSAASALPDATALASGTYRPADYSTVETGGSRPAWSSIIPEPPPSILPSLGRSQAAPGAFTSRTMPAAMPVASGGGASRSPTTSSSSLTTSPMKAGATSYGATTAAKSISGT
jgi:hypothetical protein